MRQAARQRALRSPRIRMRGLHFSFAAGLIPPVAAGCNAAGDHPDLRAVLDRQVAAWNAGDLDGFMAGYWRSPELVFSTPGSTVRGWDAVRARYEQTYGRPGKMGRLRFSDVVVKELDEPDSAQVSGRYEVQNDAGRRTGRFFLNMRRIDGRWVIVRDYTVSD